MNVLRSREKEKRNEETRWSALQQISRAARKINQKLWNARREEKVSISLSYHVSYHVFISRFNSSMIPLRVRP